MTNNGSASGELTAEEQRLLSSFWSYCQPVDLYCVLANRFDKRVNAALSPPAPPPPSLETYLLLCLLTNALCTRSLYFWHARCARMRAPGRCRRPPAVWRSTSAALASLVHCQLSPHSAKSRQTTYV